MNVLDRVAVVRLVAMCGPLLLGAGACGAGAAVKCADVGETGCADAGSEGAAPDTTLGEPDDADRDTDGPAPDGPGSNDGAGLQADDRELCMNLAAALAPLVCADGAGRFAGCADTIERGACLPETRTALRCGIAAGSEAFRCAIGRTFIQPDFCQAENAALLACVSQP